MNFVVRRRKHGGIAHRTQHRPADVRHGAAGRYCTVRLYPGLVTPSSVALITVVCGVVAHVKSPVAESMVPALGLDTFHVAESVMSTFPGVAVAVNWSVPPDWQLEDCAVTVMLEMLESWTVIVAEPLCVW